MYRIGAFSKLGKTTVKTLRHYDEVGLLKPALVDEENGYRYYTTSQLYTLHEAVALRQMGFSVAETLSIIDGHNVAGILTQRRTELKRELDDISEQTLRLEHYISQRKEGLNMEYQAVVKEIPECVIYSKRQVIPHYGALFELIPAIGAAVKQANPGLQCAKPEYCFNIYPDGEYKETDIDIEFCEAVTEFGVESDGIAFKTLPAAMIVSVMHRGSYAGLGSAYAYAFNWIERNGYEPADNPRESYIDGIWNKSSEGEWLTEVQIPLKRR
jgi:DNA-binding transcriptional MerR regulator/DNA gyrase inhibitor GyrI